ncbi:MAG: YlmH/Sll1252 family protein [Bacillota bacterium]
MDLNPAEKKWARYFSSLLEKVSAQQGESRTPFADPRQQELAQQLSRSFPACSIFFDGGYPGAERARILVIPRTWPPRKENFTIPVLIAGEFPPGMLNHRDFLGAILGLGIRREMVGDIICREKETLVFLVPELAAFVAQNLQQVGRYPVHTTVLKEVPPNLIQGKGRVREIQGTVASLRLDAVAGLGFGLSRSRITPLVRGEQVKLNHQLISQPSRPVKEGDLISLAGRGRVEVVEILGETRKGRISLKLRRML